MDCYIEASNYDIGEQVLIELILIWFGCWDRIGLRWFKEGARKGKGGCLAGTELHWGRGGWIIEEGWGLDRIKTNGNVDTDTTDEAAARLLWLTDTVTGPPASHDTQTSLMEFASDPHFIVTGQDQDDWSPQSRVTNWNQSPHWNWPGCIDRAECTGTREMLTK